MLPASIRRAAGRRLAYVAALGALLGLFAACAPGAPAARHKVYHFCVCQKASSQWKTGDQLTLTWLAQDDGETTDASPQKVRLTIEVRGPFASPPEPGPNLTEQQIRQAPLLVSSTVETTDWASADQAATLHVPASAPPGDYLFAQISDMGASPSSFNGWREEHPIKIVA